MKSLFPLKGYLSLHVGTVAVLPVITIACLVWFFMMPAIQDRARIRHQVMAHCIAGQISAHLEGGQRQLSALARFLPNRNVQPDTQTVRLLDAQCGNGEFFEALFIADDANAAIQTIGLAQSRRPSRIDYVGLDLSARSFFSKVKGKGKSAWSETFLSTVSSRMAVALTIPLQDGFITGEITLDNLSEIISHLPVESEFRTLVIDGQGMIVADSHKRRWGEMLDVNFLAAAIDTPASSITFKLDGQSMLGTLVAMDTAGWKVLVAQPIRKAFQPLRDTFGLIGLGLAVALGLVLCVAWFLAGKCTVLFTSYAEQAEAIAKGRYDMQWPTARVKEFSRLGKSLKRMAERISQRERALVDSEEQLKELVANVPGVVYRYAPNPKTPESRSLTSFVREKTIDIFGLDSGQENFFKAFVACLPEDDRHRFVTSVKDSGKALTPWYYEGRFVKPCGETIWFEGRSMPRKVGDGIVYYGMLTDISERKELESRLRLTQFIFDKAPIGIWRMDGQGEVLDVNEHGCASLGYSRVELCGMTIFDLVPDFGPGDWAHSTTILNENGTNTAEGSYRTKSGDILSIQVVENLMRFEDQEFLVAFVQDITRRKKDEAELRRLRNYLSNIIDSMPSILVAVDREGRVTLWNHRTEQVTGVSLEKAHSQPLAMVFPRLADEMARIGTAIQERRVVTSPSVSHKVAHETRYEDITIFPLVVSGVEGAVIRVDDVTQKVRMEEMVIQSEKMLSVGGLAAGMAHEINNPLAGILQSASVLENRLLGNLPANQKAAESAGTTLSAIRQYLALRRLPDLIGNIREAGSRAADIVENMLSFARKSDRRVSSQDLGVLLDRALELVRTDYDIKTHYDVKQIRIKREYDSAAPSVPCKASKLQQVFMNILKNGAEAMAEVVDAPDPPTFVLRVRDDGAWVRVEIEDNGPGMDEVTRRRIFEPFFTTKAVGKGTGLGLSVSYFIITEDHCGEMGVYAADGGGTCFVIRLPKAGR